MEGNTKGHVLRLKKIGIVKIIKEEKILAIVSYGTRTNISPSFLTA